MFTRFSERVAARNVSSTIARTSLSRTLSNRFPRDRRDRLTQRLDKEVNRGRKARGQVFRVLSREANDSAGRFSGDVPPAIRDMQKSEDKWRWSATST